MKRWSRLLTVVVLFAQLGLAVAKLYAANGPVMVAEIVGTINPATDDYLKTAVRKAQERGARLLIIKLNTPGGLLPSMQSMVETLLQSPVPTAVYVSPQGGSATSAGVFVTMAAHFAVMAPGTTIGAAHPVLGGGADIQGDMREKIENYAVSLSRAIAEQRGRNVKWAEDAVRESVSITDREAVAEKVVDFTASDISRLLLELEGKTANVGGASVTMRDLATAPLEEVPMNLRQQVANFLSDPNIAMLLGLGALLGIGIELYHPGAVLPGVFGAICLVLSLIAAQVVPINTGGLLLLVLAAAFFAAEVFVPSFGVLGVAGVICLILGSLYFVDTEQVWSQSGFAVEKGLVGSLAAVTGGLLMLVSTVAVRAQRGEFKTGKEGLVGKDAVAVTDFVADDSGGSGRVRVVGEIWQARIDSSGDSSSAELPKAGASLTVVSVTDGLKLLVRRT